jgi:hypothetical protein
VADAAQARGFQRQFGGRDVHPHAADHDRHQFLFAQPQAEIIDAVSQYLQPDIIARGKAVQVQRRGKILRFPAVAAGKGFGYHPASLPRSTWLTASTASTRHSIAISTVAACACWKIERWKYSIWPSPPAPTKPSTAAMRMFISRR